MKKNKQGQLILYGNLWRVMWKLSVPATLGMMLFGLNSFVDALFVGQLLGEKALAGVSLAFPLSQITFGFGAMIGVGGASVLSIAIGAKDLATQRKLLGNITALSLLVSLAISIPCFVFSDALIGFVGGSGELLAIGSAYFEITTLGNFLTIFSLSGNMLIRGEGKMKEAMSLGAIGMVANMLLNPLFISVFGWGVAGAAWATNAAMLCGTLANLWYFFSGKASFQADPAHVGLDMKLVRAMFSIGFPSLVMSLMNLVQQIMMFRMVASLGTDSDIAFLGAANRIMLVLIAPVFGLVRSLQPVVGINYGAGHYRRVKQAFNLFTLAGFTLMLACWLPMHLFPQAALSAMLPGVTFSLQDLENFRVYLITVPALPVLFNSITLFQSVGNGKMATWLSLGRQVLLFFPAILLFSHIYGIEGVYYSIALVDLLMVAVCSLLAWQFMGGMGKKTPETSADRGLAAAKQA